MIITNEELLRKPCESVLSIEESKDIALKLESALLWSFKRNMPGVGLAAPQIGIYKRMAIIRIDKAFKVDLVNPKIVFTDHLFDFKGEGCLSFPNLFKTTKRFQEIAVETMNNKFIATDFLAVAIQHEIDHLNQILLSDK